MTQYTSFPIYPIRTLIFVIGLAAGAFANAQGTASQPAIDDGSPETDQLSESQKPADAEAIHEGAGPVDCASLLAQDAANESSNSQPTDASRADNTAPPTSGPVASPYRESQPGQDTQISTLEECRAEQNARVNQEAHGADSE